MILVLHSRVPDRLAPTDFDAKMAMLSDDFHPGILKYSRQSDRIRSLGAKLLLRKAADELGLKEPLNYGMDTATGRPYFSGHPDFDFSLAHSGEAVICAASSAGRIGVDTEKIRSVNLDLFSAVLSEIEMSELRKSPAPERDFFNLWCAKEAMAKADGRGIFLPFSGLEIKQGKCFAGRVQMNVRAIEVYDGYCAALAFEGAGLRQVEVRAVDLIE